MDFWLRHTASRFYSFRPWRNSHSRFRFQATGRLMARVTAALLSQALHLCHYTPSYDVSQAATPPAAEVGGKGTESTVSYSIGSTFLSTRRRRPITIDVLCFHWSSPYSRKSNATAEAGSGRPLASQASRSDSFHPCRIRPPPSLCGPRQDELLAAITGLACSLGRAALDHLGPPSWVLLFARNKPHQITCYVKGTTEAGSAKCGGG
ncbi:hypothetical protein B0H13DRAFT_159106 [Mycena leptocephala]|nr:hypothetical protein B0H13DRAFT_159106 [Mycena leptocephala]